MDSSYIKTLLSKYGLKPNFTYGQNFLLDEIVLEDMADAAEITRQDAVLEIGPGIGNLTRKLCERAGFVLAVEKDPKFQPILYSLKKEFKENFRFEIADALQLDFMAAFRERGYESYKVVANIPYYVTGKILEMLLKQNPRPKSIVVLTQKEVAQRVVAEPGDLSLLAISVQLFGQPKILKIVPAKSFFPAPKVDSAVLKIEIFEKPEYILEDEKTFFKILKACFSGKRKQLHNTLTANLHLPKDKVLQILSSLGLDAKARPQQLTIADWINLAKKISSD